MMRGITDTVKHLLIINVIMFIGTMLVGGGNGELFIRWFSIYFPKNELFQPWQVITHMFMHGSFQHILFNMFLLWMFGTAVEQIIGSKRFLFLYISAGLGATLLPLLIDYFDYYSILNKLIESGFEKNKIISTLESGMINTGWESVLGQEKMKTFMGLNFNKLSLGASGAVMGVLAAFGFMFPNRKLMLLFPPIPIKAKWFVLGYGAIELYSGFANNPNDNVAHFAHLGGMLFGFILIQMWKKDRGTFY